ncbi:MAG: hypothetical protein EXS17_07135 [Phycisphaerales bacterium]|nr:hypothetical protein [Phycisphaerales bacterium]
MTDHWLIVASLAAILAAILAQLELATRDVCIQFYLVRADELGWRLHGALVAGGPLADHVEQMFARDLARSTRATLADFTSRSWWFRARARISRLMSPLQ